MTNEINLQEHIDEVMDYFDFETTVKMMSLKNTFWINEYPEEEKIVTLRQEVRRRIKYDYNKSLNYDGDVYCSSTGGIKVTIYGKTKEDFGIEVEFVGESWGTGV